MRVLESERLILKPVETEDLAFLMELRWDASLVEYIIHNPISMDTQRQWLNNIRQKGDLALSIFYKENDGRQTLIGLTGLYDFDKLHQRAVWKSLRLLPEYQGKGIALEASRMLIAYGFNTMNLNKITSDSFEDNHAILKLLEKLGFQKEGTLKKHYFHQGVFKNAVIHSILREDFFVGFNS
jgi:RimJ/RimL family protein N-acetyltransferase